MGLETNCIRKWERKQAQIITILQILKTKQISAWESSAAIKGKLYFHGNLKCTCSNLADVPRIVSEMIWASNLAGCLMQLVCNTKVKHS